MSQKRRSKGTRPFMPLHGRKTMHHHHDDKEGAAEKAGKDVMQVGVDAMIHDPRESAKAKQDAELPVPEDFETAKESSGNADGAALNGGGSDELDALREERDTYLDLARRERADFDNYRKRMQRELQNMKREALANFLKDFFGPLDDLDRVLQESVKNQSYESLLQGVRIMEENFWRTLAKAGVRKIDAKGKQFDPALHEAMAAVPSTDVPPNTVLEVYDSGYKLDDHILRPARVVVSRTPDA